jgi:hypothetical protein
VGEDSSVRVSGENAANSSGVPEVNAPVVGSTEKAALREAVDVVVPSTNGELVPESCKESDVMSPAKSVPVATAASEAVIVAVRLPPMPAEVVVVNW